MLTFFILIQVMQAISADSKKPEAIIQELDNVRILPEEWN
jgi:hypothetical protein